MSENAKISMEADVEGVLKGLEQAQAAFNQTVEKMKVKAKESQKDMTPKPDPTLYSELGKKFGSKFSDNFRGALEDLLPMGEKLSKMFHSDVFANGVGAGIGGMIGGLLAQIPGVMAGMINKTLDKADQYNEIGYATGMEPEEVVAIKKSMKGTSMTIDQLQKALMVFQSKIDGNAKAFDDLGVKLYDGKALRRTPEIFEDTLRAIARQAQGRDSNYAAELFGRRANPGAIVHAAQNMGENGNLKKVERADVVGLAEAEEIRRGKANWDGIINAISAGFTKVAIGGIGGVAFTGVGNNVKNGITPEHAPIDAEYEQLRTKYYAKLNANDKAELQYKPGFFGLNNNDFQLAASNEGMDYRLEIQKYRKLQAEDKIGAEHEQKVNDVEDKERKAKDARLWAAALDGKGTLGAFRGTSTDYSTRMEQLNKAVKDLEAEYIRQGIEQKANDLTIAPEKRDAAAKAMEEKALKIREWLLEYDQVEKEALKAEKESAKKIQEYNLAIANIDRSIERADNASEDQKKSRTIKWEQEDYNQSKRDRDESVDEKFKVAEKALEAAYKSLTAGAQGKPLVAGAQERLNEWKEQQSAMIAEAKEREERMRKERDRMDALEEKMYQRQTETAKQQQEDLVRAEERLARLEQKKILEAQLQEQKTLNQKVSNIRTNT